MDATVGFAEYVRYVVFIFRYFVTEMTECCDSGSIPDMYGINGLVHLLAALTNCKFVKVRKT